MVWAIRSSLVAEAISAEAATGEAEALAMEAAEAINACQPWNKPDSILI
jgi:hypothetical protein